MAPPRVERLTKTCAQCRKEFQVPRWRASATTCSHRCAVRQRAKSCERKELFVCKGCGLTRIVPRSYARRQIFCSKACMELAPSIMTLKASRHGEKNPMWKGGKPSVRKDRYLSVRALGHPFATQGNMLEHRLVMERWLRKYQPDSPFLIEIDGKKYLSPDFEVHHKDLSRSNNDISNLQCMTRAEHRAEHQRITKLALAHYREHVLLKA